MSRRVCRITSSIVFLLSATLAGAQAKRPITLEDLWAVKRVGAPSLDPTGAWAAAEVTTFSMDDNAGTSITGRCGEKELADSIPTDSQLSDMTGDSSYVVQIELVSGCL